MNGDIQRVYATQLQTLGPDSICEACETPIRRLHLWADLNTDGIAVACSVNPENKP